MITSRAIGLPNAAVAMKQLKPLAPVEEETFLNVAVQRIPPLCMGTVPVSQPAPLQPENCEPVPAVALKATKLESGKRA